MSQFALITLIAIFSYSLAIDIFPFTKNDSNSYEKIAISTLKEFKSVQDAFYAVGILDFLKSKIDSSLYCKKFEKELEGKDLKSISFALRGMKIMKCKMDLSDNVKSIVHEGFTGSLRQMVNAGFAAVAANIPIPETYLKTLMTFAQPDGTFRISAGQKSSATVVSASQAYYILTQYNTNIKSYSKTLNDGFNSLLGELEEDDDTLSFGESHQLQTTARILAGYFSIPAIEVSISTQQIQQLTNYFLAHKSTSVVEECYFVYLGLSALQKNPKGKPLVVVLDTPVLGDDSKGQVKLHASSIFDEKIEGTELNLIESVLNDETVLSEQTGEVRGKDTFIRIFSDSKPGNYLLKLEVNPPKAYLHQDVYVVHCTVKTGVNIKTASISLSNGKQSTAKYPSKFSESLSADPSTVITVTFELSEKEFVPQQTFVQFVHDTIEVTSVAVSKNGIFTATVNLKETSHVSEHFKYTSGDYKIFILIGDTSVEDPIFWEFGKIHITLPAAPSKELPLYHRPLLYESDTTLKPLPNFDHIFRAPDNRANALFATLFAILCISPIGIYVLYLMYMKTTFFNFPFRSVIWAAGFHGSLLVIMYLFFQYWINLTMFSVLGYLCPLITSTAFFGYKLFAVLETIPKDAHPKKE